MINLPKLLKLCLALSLSVMVVSFAYAIRSKKSWLAPRETFGYQVKPWYKYHPDGKPGREITLYFESLKLDHHLQVTISCDGKTTALTQEVKNQHLDSLTVLLPENAGIAATNAELTVISGAKKWVEKIIVPAKKQWTVYIYPHSHLDIGYTNTQAIVEELHVRNIDVAIDIANKTKDYPAGAKFIWNPEATWIVQSYLKKASPKQKESFIAAVRKGWIQIDGAHSNLNTSTCSDEELLRVFKNKADIEAITGVPISTMVQMDNPGATWGLVQAAAKNGIKGFFSFPNYFDLRHGWENKPFYWLGQDGKSKIFYLQATSYGYGFKAKGSIYGLGKIQALTDRYDRLSTNDPLKNFIDPFIFEETARLERRGFPYDIFAMTWSMADNCLIDADLPEAVKLWNEKYAYPKLIIAGTKEIMAAYEQKYASIIPVHKGDMTEFWTQGLGSDAKSVAEGRRGKEMLVQAETLWAMLQKNPAPIHQFNTAWENTLLSAEHTWGFQDPSAPLAKQVEATKASYFSESEKQGQQLVDLALQSIKQEDGNGIAVINTLSWPRDGIVSLSAAQSAKGDRIVDEQEQEMLTQRLTTGELAFEAKNIPALGSKFYRILPGKRKSETKMVNGNVISNQLVTVTLNNKTGNIQRFTDLRSNTQLVDDQSAFGMNSYNYLAGVRNGSTSSPLGNISNATQVSIKIKENGPLIASLEVRSAAESCKWLTREVKLTKNKPFIELINTIDKLSSRKKEGIHYGFAFNVPNGEMKIDIPLGVMVPESDQINYSNKNWFAFQRWIDISNNDYGVTWTALEAPIFEIGEITGTILDGARLPGEWLRKVPKSQTILSWPINNHWNTNFPLEQGGIITNHYLILPHQGGYDPVIANRFGVEQHRPLIAVQTNKNPIKNSIVTLDNPKVMISTIKKSEDNKAIIVRLRSISGLPEQLNFEWAARKPKAIYACMPNEIPMALALGTVTIDAFATDSYRIEF
jgi:alpha-mannosidase